MKEEITYNIEFELNELEIIRKYLFEAPVNPCKECLDKNSCTGCPEYFDYESKFLEPFRNVFKGSTSNLLNEIITYRNMLDQEKSLELELKNLVKRRTESINKFPKSLNNMIVENKEKESSSHSFRVLM